MGFTERLHPRDHDGKFAHGSGMRVTARDGRGAAAVHTALPQGVEMISLARLRAQIRFGTDGFDYETAKGWQDVVARQLDNPNTPAFLADIMRNGMQPIRVNTSAAGGPLADADEVRDGNHRLAAAMLLGVAHVPVTRRDLADGGGKYKVPVQVGEHVGPLPEGAGEVLQRARELLKLPDPGHEALMDAELERLAALAEARDAALEAENAAHDERQRLRREARGHH